VLIPITSCRKPTLVADDGTFLGTASSNEYEADGVCNEYSDYGGKYGTNSIHNEYGTYGSKYSSSSAYDEYTSTPPSLRCESGAILNPVTKNKYLTNPIDPDVLCETLKANGF
jgi:hypothetical protein